MPSGPSRCELGQSVQAETPPVPRFKIRAARASKLFYAMVKYSTLQPRSTR